MSHYCHRTVFLLSLLHVVLSTEPVYFSLIVSGGENGFRSSGVIPAIDIALEEIERHQILPGYNLTYDKYQNSKCSQTDSLNVFFEDIQSSSKPKIAVIGCGCSVATVPVAEISHYWNISQISFASATASLSERTRFRNFFRTLPSFNNYAPAILGLLNTFKWKRLAFLTLNENLFLKGYADHEELLQNLKDGTSKECCFDNHEITTKNIVFEHGEDPVSAVQQIFDEKEYHVFVLNCYSLHARQLICEAARRNLVYPNYAWIVYAWYPEKWWTEGDDLDGCTNDFLEDFLIRARALLLNIVAEPDDFDAITDGGFTATEFTKMYEERLETTDFKVTIAYTMAFDAVWTLALALNSTESMRLQNTDDPFNCSVDNTGQLVALNEFNYSNSYMGCIIKHNMHQVEFLGVTGPVKYGSDGTIIYNKIRLAQYRDTSGNGTASRVRFGYLDRRSNYSLLHEDGESDGRIFKDGIPPDGTPRHITRTYKTWLVVIYYFLALCGVIFSIICFGFNFVFRERRVVRLTSPTLNYIIITGALLMYLFVFIEFLPSTKKSFIKAQCTIPMWLYGMGYLLVYGTILAKMWRVYQIFHNPTPSKSVLKTWHLLCIVGSVSGIGVVFIFIKTLVQLLNDPKLVADTENPSQITTSDIREEYSTWRCYETGSLSFVFDVIIFSYLSLLQLVGIILAFQTRKVKINVLNDSKSVATLIYISSIVLVVIVLIRFFLRSYINAGTAIFCGGILLLATIFLVLIFCPKMVNLYRDPFGEKVFDGSSYRTDPKSTIEHHSMAMGLPDLTLAEKIDLLNTRVKGLEEKLKERNEKITELENINRSLKRKETVI